LIDIIKVYHRINILFEDISCADCDLQLIK